MAIRAACPAAQADDASDTAVSSDSPLQADFRYSAYREGALPADKISNTSGDRYHVDSYQLRLSDTLAGTNDLAADLVVETMGGASPWFITPGANGKAVQVLSGASIRDRRQALTLNGTNTINVNFLGVPQVGTYPIVSFGSLAGGGTFSLAAFQARATGADDEFAHPERIIDST